MSRRVTGAPDEVDGLGIPVEVIDAAAPYGDVRADSC
jgi:hypothetical protein